MRMDQLKVGDPVLFGRGKGEKTKGTITKKNLKTCKVRQDEERGTQKSHKIGTIWTVPPALIYPDPSRQKGETPATEPPVPTKQPLKFNRFNEDNNIIEAILDVYNRLSPEWLTADGERPHREVRRLANELHNKLHHLQKALGYEVTELEAFNWFEEKRAFEREQAKKQEQKA